MNQLFGYQRPTSIDDPLSIQKVQEGQITATYVLVLWCRLYPEKNFSLYDHTLLLHVIVYVVVLICRHCQEYFGAHQSHELQWNSVCAISELGSITFIDTNNMALWLSCHVGSYSLKRINSRSISCIGTTTIILHDTFYGQKIELFHSTIKLFLSLTDIK